MAAIAPPTWLEALLQALELPAAFGEAVDSLWRPLTERILAEAPTRSRPLVVGLCGPQGSGKSTGVAIIRRLLEDAGRSVAILSIDDIYLTRAERLKLSKDVHPLLATRGPPGTHDIALGQAALRALSASGEARLPRFDKARDDRMPKPLWPYVAAPVDCVLLEGWCVGARPQPARDLAAPVNVLEAEQDLAGVWRTYVNAALAGPYQQLFARLDLLFLLKAPSFECVTTWRQEQEAKLRATRPDAPHVMSDEQIGHFVQHYERISRWIDSEMPARADAVARLDSRRRLETLTIRDAS